MPGQPERYYPSGKRSFFRLVASDDYQGRAGATFMKNLGVRRVYVLNDDGLYGKGVAAAFRKSAKNKKHIRIIAGSGSWDNDTEDVRPS